jgi:NADH dehydrogenase FAD-containing subunit
MSSLCLVYLARLANCCPHGSTETSAWATGMQASPTEHGVHAQCQLGVLNVKSDFALTNLSDIYIEGEL